MPEHPLDQHSQHDPVLALLADPPAPEMGLDETALYAAGRRRVRRRRVAASLAGAAVATLAVVGLWALPRESPTTITAASPSPTGTEGSAPSASPGCGPGQALPLKVSDTAVEVRLARCSDARVDGEVATASGSARFALPALRDAHFVVAPGSGGAAPIAVTITPKGQRMCDVQPGLARYSWVDPPVTAALAAPLAGWSVSAHTITNDFPPQEWRATICTGSEPDVKEVAVLEPVVATAGVAPTSSVSRRE